LPWIKDAKKGPVCAYGPLSFTTIVKLFAMGSAEPTPRSVVNIDAQRFLPVLVPAHFIFLKKAPLSASECNDY